MRPTCGVFDRYQSSDSDCLTLFSSLLIPRLTALEVSVLSPSVRISVLGILDDTKSYPTH